MPGHHRLLSSVYEIKALLLPKIWPLRNIHERGQRLAQNSGLKRWNNPDVELSGTLLTSTSSCLSSFLLDILMSNIFDLLKPCSLIIPRNSMSFTRDPARPFAQVMKGPLKFFMTQPKIP